MLRSALYSMISVEQANLLYVRSLPPFVIKHVHPKLSANVDVVI